jgi:riboflavin synthase
MFTGIIETLGSVQNIVQEGTNYHFTIASSISKDLKIDQSLAHNGVCLTVTACDAETHTVTAILETLNRTNLGAWRVGEEVNLERAMQVGARLDGHNVQGHVDAVGECCEVRDAEGSWYYRFAFPSEYKHLLIDKGSICINGTSLTVINPTETEFSVAIIPYTYEHTNFKHIRVGTQINLEFDIIGKYLARFMQHYK